MTTARVSLLPDMARLWQTARANALEIGNELSDDAAGFCCISNHGLDTLMSERLLGKPQMNVAASIATSAVNFSAAARTRVAWPAQAVFASKREL